MCLVLKDQKRKKPSVAKRDITVVKAGFTLDEGQTFNPIYMPYFTYSKGETSKHTEMEIEIEDVQGTAMDGKIVMYPKNVVNIGYHAFTDFHSCEIVMRHISPLWRRDYPLRNFCIGEFTIPAGAKYFIGNDGDIVASEIRFERTLATFGDETDKVRKKMKSNKRLR